MGRLVVTSRPDVALVLTTHNYARYLPDCLRSVGEQTIGAGRLVIVDDASTDETGDVLAHLLQSRQLADDVVVVRNARRQGLARSLNAGIRRAGTRYVAHVDADDVLAPGYLEQLAAALDADPTVGFVYPRLRLFGTESGTYASYEFDVGRLLFEGSYIPNVGMMRRCAFDATAGYVDAATHIDWDLWLSFVEAGWPGALVDEPLYYWRRHDGAMTYQRTALKLALRSRILWRHRRLAWSHRAVALPWTLRAVARRIGRGCNTSAATLTPSGWVEPLSRHPPEDAAVSSP